MSTCINLSFLLTFDPGMWVLGYVGHVLFIHPPLVQPLHVVVVWFLELDSLENGLIFMGNSQGIHLSPGSVQTRQNTKYRVKLEICFKHTQSNKFHQS